MVVVVGGNVLHHVKREGELSGGGNVRRNMSRGICPEGKCPDLSMSVPFSIVSHKLCLVDPNSYIRTLVISK